MKIRTLIVDFICAIFIVLFAYAAISKLVEFEKFKAQLGQSPLTTAFASTVAWGIPFIELALSGMLAFGKTRLAALYGSFTLMIMFTTYIIVILKFSDYVPCSCGGILEKLGWTEHLLFNMFFTLLSMLGIFWSSPNSEVHLSAN